MQIELNKNEIKKYELKNFINSIIIVITAISAWLLGFEWVLTFIGILITLGIIFTLFGIFSINIEDVKNEIVNQPELSKKIIIIIKSNNLYRFIIYGIEIITFLYIGSNALFLLTWISLGVFLYFKATLEKNFKIKK